MEKSCSFLVHFDKGTPVLASEIKEALEGNDVSAKIDATKNAIMLLLNGETRPQLFNTIVRYVLLSEDDTIQKLLLLYLEILDYKTDGEGPNVLPPEMILICQNLKNNLQHPNEYIRGVTLRFLCRLNATEIIKPLFPSIISNLEHRHPYVRRNAILAVMSIFHRRVPQGEQQLSETMERFLSSEQDVSAKRNAFLMLSSCGQDDRAINYLLSNVDRVSDWGELLQKIVLEMIQKVYGTNKTERGKYIKIIVSILNASPSASVVYECAGALVSLTCAPTAIRAAANTYCQLLLTQSDNNVKLILLDRLNELIESSMSHRDIMVEMIMDVLTGGLSSPNLDAQRKTLDITLELITPGNVNEVVFTLKMEVMKTQSEKSSEYHQMLIQAIHSCAIKVPEVVRLLIDFLGDHKNRAFAMGVVIIVREIIETNSKLRVSVVTRLLDIFYQIRAARVCTCALWIIGEYCLSLSEVENAIATIKQCLGDLPFFSISEDKEEAADSSRKKQSITVSSRKPAILTDGTYATQSAASETALSPAAVVQGSLNLRSFLLTGDDFFLGAVIACTLAKLVLRLEKVQSSKVELNKASSNALLIMVSMLQLGQSPVLPLPIDNDSHDNIIFCIGLLCNTRDSVRKMWLKSCPERFLKMLSDKQLRETETKAKARHF